MTRAVASVGSHRPSAESRPVAHWSPKRKFARIALIRITGLLESLAPARKRHFTLPRLWLVQAASGILADPTARHKREPVARSANFYGFIGLLAV